MENSFNIDIVLKPGGEMPIYEQIEQQIRAGIISKKLPAGSAVPSMRTLAKVLRVSVITVQKAYENLKRDGFIESAVGRGTIVAAISTQTLLETRQKELEQKLDEAISIAKECGMDLDALIQTLRVLYKEDAV